jgi:(2Fe-2S) ferredoxin
MPLRTRLAKLLKDDPDVQLIGYACFGQCDYGPNVAFYPPGEWYGGLSAPGDAERVVQHALHAMDCAPLANPLELPEQERIEHLRNIEELIRTRERDRARPRRWVWSWWPFSAR